VQTVVHNDQNLLIRDIPKAKVEQIIDVSQKEINDEDARNRSSSICLSVFIVENVLK